MFSEPTTLISVARVIGDSLREDYDIDPVPLFAELGIDTSKFYTPGARESFEKMTRLWAAASLAANDPGFGFSVGKRAAAGDFYVFGHAWLASESLLGALRRLCRYSHVVTMATGELEIDSVGDNYALTQAYPDGAAMPHKIANDAGMAALIRLFDLVTQETVRPVAVSLSVSSDNDPARYEALFRCPVTFDNDVETWLFAAKDLEQPLVGSIPDVANATDRIAERYVQSLERNTIATEVSSMLIQTLPSGRSDQDTIARRLYRSRSTLQRQLSAEGTSYREILEATRRELAERYLKEGDFSQAQIAFMVGFADQSNFARAFKRWTGVSPGEYQKAA